MGDGEVLQSGTHSELLAQGGAYARLVQAQRLREATSGHPGTDTPLNEEREAAEIEEEAKREVPLGKTRSRQGSLSSGVVKDRMDKDGKEKEREYSIPTLFARMGAINRSEWLSYVLGVGAACVTGMVYPVFGIVYGAFIFLWSCGVVLLNWGGSTCHCRILAPGP